MRYRFALTVFAAWTTLGLLSAPVGHGGSWRVMSNSIDLFSSGYTSVILSNYTDGRSPLREAIRAIVPQ